MPILKDLSAVELKEHGNKLYRHQKYKEALEYYNRAINCDPSDYVYFTNRALCYLKLQLWEQAVKDARRSLELEPNWIKGHFFLGSALLEMENHEDAMRHLQRACDLARDQKVNFGDDIASLLRLARKRRWNQFEERRIKQEIELQSYLNNLITKDKERQIQEVSNNALDKDKMSEVESQIELKSQQYMDELNEMFKALDIRRKKRDIPDYLCGKISFDIMTDPVVTPSGITYDRKIIEEHLQRVGHFDPVTRTPLSAEQLIPNLSMKEVIDAFITENEWATEYL